MLVSVRSALSRARAPILIMASVNLLGLGSGLAMAHAGNRFALSYRDSLVARAHRDDPSARADDAGERSRAAIIDFARNLGLAAIPETVGGLTIVLPFPLAAYRGWVGGIVSVDGRHESRLADGKSAGYYLVTLLLLVPAFILAGGAGLHLGWSLVRKRGPFVGPAWFRLPGPALRDVLLIYELVVPLFAVGALWEFFSPWR
jgi:Stage II sporulation protein M